MPCRAAARPPAARSLPADVAAALSAQVGAEECEGQGPRLPASGEVRAVSPILDAIAAEHSDKIKIVKLNVDDNPQMAMKYQITSIPAMKVFRGGEVVKTVIGAKPKPAIEAELADFLA